MSPKNSAEQQTLLFDSGRITLLVLLVAALIILFNGGIQVGTANHTGLLPVVRRILDPTYLPEDFGILLRYYHHRPFAYLVAVFVAPLGEDTALTVLKIVGTVLLSGSLYAICRALNLSDLAFLALGTLLAANSALTGSGLETNTLIGNREAMPTTFAHAFVLFATALTMRRRYYAAAFFVGLTFLLHLQIGFAFGLILGSYFLIQIYGIGWRKLLIAFFCFLLPASWSIWEVSQMMKRGLVTLPFSMQDILFRQPNHFVLRSPTNTWIVTLHFGLLLVVCFWYRRRDEGDRQRANLLLWMNSLIALFCLLHIADFYLLKSGEVMKFQFLRMSVFLTLFGALAFLLLLNNLASARSRKLVELSNIAVLLGAAIFYIIPETRQASAPSFAVRKYREQNTDWVAVCSWVRENTPASALFLSPPGNEGFTYLSDRSTVVEFKINPDGPQFLSEWYERLTDVAGGTLPDKEGFANAPLLNRTYTGLPAEEIERLMERYQATYAVLFNETATLLETVFENQRYKVVRSRQ